MAVARAIGDIGAATRIAPRSRSSSAWITTTRCSSAADSNGPHRRTAHGSRWSSRPTTMRAVSDLPEIRLSRSHAVTLWPFWTTMHGQTRIGWPGSCCPTAMHSVVAVGGAPVPEFEAARPSWFPPEFDWVFGCAYSGLPEEQAPVPRLIGANMSVRRSALAEIGGFHSDNHDDMDMCHRLKHLRPADEIIYEPAAQVHHFVPAARTTWGYFWRRCYFVNRGKVEAFRQMEGAANRSADVGFVARALSRGLSRGLRQVARGDAWGAARAASIVAGVALAGSGHLAGTWQWHRTMPRPPRRKFSSRRHEWSQNP